MSLGNWLRARIYEDMNEGKDESDSLRDMRNRSTPAHGTNPVPEELWPEFRGKTEAIIKDTIGGDRFGELLSMAMHGEIHVGA